jgi:hypothetical protein
MMSGARWDGGSRGVGDASDVSGHAVGVGAAHIGEDHQGREVGLVCSSIGNLVCACMRVSGWIFV